MKCAFDSPSPGTARARTVFFVKFELPWAALLPALSAGEGAAVVWGRDNATVGPSCSTLFLCQVMLAEACVHLMATPAACEPE